MLVALSIRDIVLIDRLDLSFLPGLSVLTGETGAGKSIVLDAFALALGGRGDGRLVREGADQGQVTAVFDLPLEHPVRQRLREEGIGGEDGDVIFRRIQLKDGRSRAFVDDQPVSIQMLRALGHMLVEIHGQHDERALLDPAGHQAILDAFGGHEALLAEVRRRHAERARIADALADERERLAAAQREADYLRHADEELGALRPEPGEETALADRRQAIMRAEKASEDLRAAYDALAGSASPVPDLASVARRLERRSSVAPALVEPATKALDAAILAIEEARSHLERALEETAYDPRELERLEERLFALRAAARKYQVGVDELGAVAARIGESLAALEAGEARIGALEAELKASAAAYAEAAGALSVARHAAAARLDAAVNAELPDLKLERAVFSTRIETDPERGGAEGIDRVEFWAQTNPGSRPGPVARIASGGELSRFMLALKVSLVGRASAPTLVFDEVDTGVGGAVADAIGQRLARLASDVQVLTVTHAPQVAARADRHFRISKDVVAEGGRVATRVAALEALERREEIARMLAGARVTDEARAAATRLIEGAV